MINLIPKEEKNKLITIFYFKIVTLFFVMTGFIALVITVAILPSYLLSITRSNVIKEKLETQKAKPVPLSDQETLLVVKDLNSKLTLIEGATKNKFNISEKIINTVISKKMSRIKITDISFENDPVKGKKVSIGGNAPSREVLLLFRRALENDLAFKKVDLPISNFVKGSDIKFYLNLIPS